MPRSAAVLRASEETAVASTITSAAPPAARAPRLTRCQSVARPSVAQYWLMGEIAMRLRSATSRMRNGENRCTGEEVRTNDFPEKSRAHRLQAPPRPAGRQKYETHESDPA